MAIRMDRHPIKTYKEAESFILEALPMFQQVGRKAIAHYGLDRIRAFLHYLGNPHRDFKSIHIAGTNGKGSVSHMLSAVYQKNGYRTGLFTSPHLICYRERIKINGLYIPEGFVLNWVQLHSSFILQNQLSFFEMSMGLACTYFSDQKVDLAVMETGLGGRLDATNVIIPILSIVTNIDYDHQDLLGDTLPQIAREKAGIIKKGVPILLGNVDSELYGEFQKIARHKNASLIYSEPSFVQSSQSSKNGLIYYLSHSVLPFSLIRLPSLAPYHIHNLNTVLYVIRYLQSYEGLGLDGKLIRQGLEEFTDLTQFRGRHEIIHHQPTIIVDAAHNPGGIRFYKPLFKNKNVHLHLVLGLVKGKNLDEIFSLLPLDATYYFCAANVPRAMDAKVLQQEALLYGLKGEVYQSPKLAIEEIILNAKEEDIGLVMGSIYLLAEIL